MVAWLMKGMGGVIPRTDSRLLADNMAGQAVNCDLSSGAIKAILEPVQIIDLSAASFPVKKAYRLPGPVVGDPDTWLPLPSEYSSVVRSPLANDSTHRIYWTNPSDDIPWFSWYAQIAASGAPFNLGIVQPTTAPTVAAVGGSASPIEDRSYCYTYVNGYGEESAPSLPSTIVSGPPDADWRVSGFPTTAPANPGGVNYPPVTRMRIYRTLSSLSSGAQFYMAVELAFPVAATYHEAVLTDEFIAGQPTLETTGWANPPTKLDGLVALPGGMLAGFKGNTIHFCEPNRPHSWPPAYDQSVHYDIVGLCVWEQYLVVLTKGFPSTGVGNTPQNFVFTQVRVPEPCISRGSIITDLLAVFYASQNGLVQISGYGMQNQTLLLVEKNDWLTRYHAASIIAARHRAQYLAINGANAGFLIDYTEARLAFMDLTTFNGVTCVWNDEYTSDVYMVASEIVYRWDQPAATPVVYRWRSKKFFTPYPISLGAAQVSLDPTVADALDESTPALSNSDTTVVLPTGVNAQFKLYAGAATQLMMTRNLTTPEEVFRLPSGYKAAQWQFEVISRVPISLIQVAETIKELKGV